MQNWYKCDICGCYLDPGEGQRCEECRRREERRERDKRELRALLRMEPHQMELEDILT